MEMPVVAIGGAPLCPGGEGAPAPAPPRRAETLHQPRPPSRARAAPPGRREVRGRPTAGWEEGRRQSPGSAGAPPAEFLDGLGEGAVGRVTDRAAVRLRVAGVSAQLLVPEPPALGREDGDQRPDAAVVG